MFKSPQQYRTFLTLLFTFALDLTGYSIVFPVLAPLLLNPELHFFAAGTGTEARTIVLGLLFALFGIANFIGAPIAGALADYYGRYKIFLFTIGITIVGYSIMAIGVYVESLAWLFVGRAVTGLCSGNATLASSATADLTDAQHRSQALGILQGMGGLGFIAGPWIGGKLANQEWVHGSGPFIFSAIAAFLNFTVMLFFFKETWKRKPGQVGNLFGAFKDIRIVLRDKDLRTFLLTTLLFATGWGFLLIFGPTFLVQKFHLHPSTIGDIFAYMALNWVLVSTFLNKELAGKFSPSTLVKAGAICAAFGMLFFLWPSRLWPYWIIAPIVQFGGAVGLINLIALTSTKASEEMQGRAMGAWQSMWSIGMIIASVIAGVLAGLNLYIPLSAGAAITLLAFWYFSRRYRDRITFSA